MNATANIGSRGKVAALVAAVPFGASTPFAKALVGDMTPFVLAGLMYSGAGLGLAVVVSVRRIFGRGGVSMPTRSQIPAIVAVVAIGGVLGPLFLMLGLRRTSAVAASLMLNLESVFTALIAWTVCRESTSRRLIIGMLANFAGGVVLAWSPQDVRLVSSGTLLVAAACVCWGIDNNLTRSLSALDPELLEAIKGLGAGATSLACAAALSQALPSLAGVLSAAAVGLLGYGISVALFIYGLSQLGTARTGAYFAVAPFVGAAVGNVVFREPVTWQIAVAATLMAIGLYLHLSEQHAHTHEHEPLEHEHSHRHDEHHAHSHTEELDESDEHSHVHRHALLAHRHRHFPDLHHRHRHND